MPVTVAVHQFAPTEDKAANLRALTAGVAEAAASGAELVVCPENAMFSPPDSRTDLAPIAEPLDGPFVTALRDAALRHGVAVVAGLTKAIPGQDRVHNTVVAVSAEGELLTAYRKLHLYDAFGYRESDAVAPGDIEQPAVFRLGDVTFGVQTCYDLRFPETTRRLVDAGAQAVLVPAAWVAGPLKEEHWATLLAARAIENTIYVVGCGQTPPVCIGRSAILDPLGVVVASAGGRPGTIAGTIDPAWIAEVRQRVPVLTGRRFSVEPIEAAPAPDIP